MSDNLQDGVPNEAAVTAPTGNKRWYVVHAYSGMEKSVQRALTERIARAGMEDKFGRILVPTEEVIEVKNGHKSVTERRFFPGYVLVEMEMTDDTWHLVKNTSKVTGFIGGKSNKPTPIPPHEVDKILNWSASRMVHSPISTATSRKSTTKSPRCVFPSRSLGAQRRSNSNSARSKKFKQQPQQERPCRALHPLRNRHASNEEPLRELVLRSGANTHSNWKHHGKENHRLYQAASASW